MTIETNPKAILANLLNRAALMYLNLNTAVDTTNPEMPIISEDSGELLETYLLLYGEQDNRHGGNKSAKRYNSFMTQALDMKGLPEVDALVTRIELARVNLEVAVRGIESSTVTQLGYELRDDLGRLLVYQSIDT